MSFRVCVCCFVEMELESNEVAALKATLSLAVERATQALGKSHPSREGARRRQTVADVDRNQRERTEKAEEVLLQQRHQFLMQPAASGDLPSMEKSRLSAAPAATVVEASLLLLGSWGWIWWRYDVVAGG